MVMQDFKVPIYVPLASPSFQLHTMSIETCATGANHASRYSILAAADDEALMDLLAKLALCVTRRLARAWSKSSLHH